MDPVVGSLLQSLLPSILSECGSRRIFFYILVEFGYFHVYLEREVG